MSSLTERQRLELHKSLIQYLEPLILNNPSLTSLEQQNFISNLCRTLSIDESQYNESLSSTIPDNYLVKKWSAVVRLQKKIMDLENSLLNYKEQASLPQTLGANSDIEWVPSTIGKSLRNLGNSSVTCMSIHPFEPVLAMGTSDGVIVIWDLLNLVQPVKIVNNAHTRAVNGINFATFDSEINSQQRQILLLSCSSDLMIKIWDREYLLPLRTLTGHDHSVSHVMFHPTVPNRLVSCSRDCSIKLWDTKSNWCLKTFVGHSEWVRKFDLNCTGEYVLSCSNDQSIRLSHLESGTGVGLMIGHRQVVENCKFFNNKRSNKYLDKLALKYLYHNNEQDFKTLPHKTYDELNFKYCVSCGRDDLIKIWLLPVPQLRPHRPPMPSSNPNGSLILTLSNHASWVKDLQIHPSGRYLFSCSDDKTIKIWDLDDDCRCITTLLKHELFVNCITFASPIIDVVGEGEDAEEKIGYRNYFASGGVDKLIVWS